MNRPTAIIANKSSKMFIRSIQYVLYDVVIRRSTPLRNTLRTIGMSENNEVTVTAAENGTAVSRERKHRTFADRMSGHEEKYVIEELDQSAVGKERFY